MSGAPYLDMLRWLAPEVLLAVTAGVVLFVDLGLARSRPLQFRSRLAGGLTVLGMLAGLAWLCQVPIVARWGGGILALGPLTSVVKGVLVGLTVLTVLIAMGSDPPPHVGEFYALMVLATVGMCLMVSSREMLMIFLALELTSLCLYVLTAFQPRNPGAVRAALQYFLFGSVASAFLLFGFSLWYGLCGSTGLADVAAALRARGLDPLAGVALVMVITGLGFKVAAVPFHLWAPETYRGAPTPVAALIAAGSKVASFVLLAQVLGVGLDAVAGSAAWGGWRSGWMPVAAVLAVGSMAWGNLAALVQDDVKRLLAYSAIAHGGYLIVGLFAVVQPADHGLGVSAMVYYLATYGLTLVGAFGVISVLERQGVGSRFADLAGLSRRSPLLAGCWLVLLLSLAGIPPLAGFFGKFYVFTMAVAAGGGDLGLLWLVVVAILFSAVSLYYYLKALKPVFVQPPTASAAPLRITLTEGIALGVIVAAVVLLGVLPGWIVDGVLEAVQAQSWLSN
ncbi:MAG TPA: NADH-quinone oxidoreductase subunit N [Verrucomicrobiota bacterium]|nr:NADH-quinone oxidoreductase subunit N [Verrucomicrobiota bacterium]HNU51533.1 NADH-quinone oxidoreductase subunit N [Verrucomicrobiota bacterium]